ncbi:hypothetical protein [Rhizobium leguminosarum]|uniref:hypothetical protein n=1 Tax=Rhizobium leguminosarum TaxID=384 RepID=UPI00124ACD5B|nr:hypothetical protein [Rhizobium leguminosarum]
MAPAVRAPLHVQTASIDDGCDPRLGERSQRVADPDSRIRRDAFFAAFNADAEFRIMFATTWPFQGPVAARTSAKAPEMRSFIILPLKYDPSAP